MDYDEDDFDEDVAANCAKEIQIKLKNYCKLDDRSILASRCWLNFVKRFRFMKWVLIIAAMFCAYSAARIEEACILVHKAKEGDWQAERHRVEVPPIESFNWNDRGRV